MLSTIEKVIQLRTVEMLTGTSDEVLAEVASALEEVEAEEGDEVLAKGQVTGKMYLIVTGRAEVRDGDTTLSQLGPRDVFGELAVLDPEPSPSAVVAQEHMLMLALDHLPLLELMTEHIEMTAGIVRFLCQRARH
ncbi:MAG TPA: cyclic nucleotide-binding domain-containing protein [Chloroflexota bacterium]|nr:cyclic nucleotide-binding domain-containing protein [Chloroflexota bacterium]